MRLSIVAISLIAVGVVSTFPLTVPRTSQSSAPDLAVDSETTTLALLSPTTVRSLDVHTDNHTHDEADLAPETNAAADFWSLPAEQQAEITRLSGRESDEGKSYQVIEVQPGVVAVMVNNGPKVVPVAVMNDDGTVSIHEY